MKYICQVINTSIFAYTNTPLSKPGFNTSERLLIATTDNAVNAKALCNAINKTVATNEDASLVEYRDACCEYVDIITYRVQAKKAIDHFSKVNSFAQLANYYNGIGVGSEFIMSLSPAQQLEYLGSLYRTQNTLFPFHNFLLRRASQSHPLFRKPLELINYQSIKSGKNGGYCFQSSELLYWRLSAIGFDVTRVIAKVLNGLKPNSEKAKRLPSTHLILVVTIGENRYLLDPGLSMKGQLSPIIITNETSKFQHGKYNFQLLKQNDSYILSREDSGKWVTIMESTFSPATLSNVKSQLTILQCFPLELGIRDNIILLSITTEDCIKTLLWNKNKEVFTYTIERYTEIECEKQEIHNVKEAYQLLSTDFKIHHISFLKFKSLCFDVEWPKLDSSAEIQFPIDNTETDRLKQSFT